MGNLFASLGSAAETLRVFERSLAVVQNNVSNASTPGFAKQRQILLARPFDLQAGIAGGVRAGELEDFRNRFAERAVWRQQEILGRFSQRAADLTALEPVFEIRDAGIPGALTRLFQGFSQLTVSPNDVTVRRIVLDRAQDLAGSFNAASRALITAGLHAGEQTRDVVDQINTLAGRVARINAARRQNAAESRDPASDTELHSALEQLSELVDITVLEQEDGGATVFLGGQTLLVIGDRQYAISADLSGPQTVILDAANNDVTAQVSSGRLSALLEERNVWVPSLLADLDRLAESTADQINLTLAAGVDLNGVAPGVDLFTYDNVAGAALSLAANPLAPEQLAAALPGAPGGNGNALNLAALPDAAVIDGFTLTGFYGALAGRVGRELATARDNAATQQDLVLQARALRHELSGVSLDEEAAQLLAFQRAYQATAQLFRVLNDLTGEVIALLR